jgi:hypothetical protein
MVVNFRVRGISRGARKLARTPKVNFKKKKQRCQGRWHTRGSSLCSNHQKRLCTVLQAKPRPKTPHRETQSALPPLSSSSFSHREIIIILKQNEVDWCSTFYASIGLYRGLPCPSSGPFVLN